MKDLFQIYPNNGALLGFTYALSLALIVFNLSWSDLFIVLLIDYFAHFAVFPLFQWFFFKIHPNFRVLKDVEGAARKIKNDFPAQEVFYQELSTFPEQRALYVFVLSFIKVIPVGLYISYKSNISESFLLKLGLFYLIDYFVMVFISGHLFIQLHEMASDCMKKFKDMDGWKDNYRRLRPLNFQDRFFLVQNTVITSLVLNLVVITFILTKNDLVTQKYIPIFYLSAILCIGSSLYYFQKFFHKSLSAILEYLKLDFKTAGLNVLPLHTSSTLSGFEVAINQLGEQIEAREVEIAKWLKHESEQFHLRSLGEVTALVAHDIKTPLHIMQMSCEVIKDSSLSMEMRDKYMKILEKNLHQTISFTQTLMAYLRGDNEASPCSYSYVHENLMDLLQTQYPADDFNRIHFQISTRCLSMKLDVRHLDAMHIFYNIYQNAIKSVLSKPGNNPSIVIEGEDVQNGLSRILVRDNGLGLGVEKFNQLMSPERFIRGGDFKGGLGLRITKTILNRLQGELNLIPIEVGACFEIKIPAPQLTDVGFTSETSHSVQ